MYFCPQKSDYPASELGGFLVFFSDLIRSFFQRNAQQNSKIKILSAWVSTRCLDDFFRTDFQSLEEGTGTLVTVL